MFLIITAIIILRAIPATTVLPVVHVRAQAALLPAVQAPVHPVAEAVHL
jgi:hypothetical protein